MDKLRLVSTTLGEERVKLGEKLSYYTANKTEGLAEALYIATTVRELIQVLDLCIQLKVPYFVLGGGTKVMISDEGFLGLVIKNRTSAIKVNGIKGKVNQKGIGIEEALIEVDSGVSIGKFNEFLKEQNLRGFFGNSSLHSTIGGSLLLDPALLFLVQKIKVWENGEVFDVESGELKRRMVVLSVIFKIKARD